MPKPQIALNSARRFLAFWLAAFFAESALAGIHGPMTWLNTTTPYLIYYGNWDSGTVNFARTNYNLVILHPASNITPAEIVRIRSGKDAILGTADDVVVLAYLSVGEDNRTGAPFAGDKLGPRVDPRASDSLPLSGITNALGLPSAGGTNYASYYLNAKSNQTGVPDQDPNFPGSYYINAGAPAWWNVIKNMTKSSGDQAGLDEILTSNVGNAYNCDGVFLDTIDTAAPDSWGTSYEWTSPGMQALIRQIRTNYPNKFIMANRGLFYYDSNLKTYPYTIRPYVDMVMWESYFSDSSTNLISPSFLDNKFEYAPKINAEAGRPDGFTVVALDYDHTPPQPSSIVNQDYTECMNIQGWPLYRNNPYLAEPPNTNTAAWMASNADTQPPVWDSTTAVSSDKPPPRVGMQEVMAGNNCATVYWDVAHDQTGPVRYNIYYYAGTTMNFAAASRLTNVVATIPTNYLTGTGPGRYPYACVVTNVQNGTTYCFAVRAQDSANPPHEDTNIVAIAATPGTAGMAGSYKSIHIDGNFSDWTNVPWAFQGSADGNAVNFSQIQFANDTNYLYGHFKLFSPYAPFSDYNTHLFIDTDNNGQTGYQVTGALFGSEFMVESGFGYDQRNGSFNAGTVSGPGWAIAPATTANEFEFRISLSALYADGTKVFATNSFRILLQDDRGPEIAVETGIPYTLAPPQLGPLLVSGSGDRIIISWTGLGTLQCSSSLTGSWTNLQAATSPYTVQIGNGLQFFRLAR